MPATSASRLTSRKRRGSGRVHGVARQEIWIPSQESLQDILGLVGLLSKTDETVPVPEEQSS
jgi:hypothetical protein